MLDRVKDDIEHEKVKRCVTVGMIELSWACAHGSTRSRELELHGALYSILYFRFSIILSDRRLVLHRGGGDDAEDVDNMSFAARFAMFNK